METITLFYLALGVCLFLLIMLGNSYLRYNALKESYELNNITLATTQSKLIKAEKRLEQYEETNVLLIKDINELNEECDRYLTSSNGYQLKCNELDAELDAYATKISEYELENIDLKEELDDKVVFINALNERLQKAEAERDKLQSKLSRKGLGKKGRKKENVIFEKPIDDSQITEVEFEEEKYVDITSTEQLKQYVGYKFECVLTDEGCYITFRGKLISNGKIFILAFNGSNGWELSESERSLADNLYNKGWGVFDDDFGGTIKSLKILL